MSSVELFRDGAAWCVRVSSEIDLAIAPLLQARLAEAAREEGALVIVDMTRCLYIDSTGVAALLNASRRLTRSKGALGVACPNPTPLRVFEVTNTAATLNLASTMDEARALAERWRKRLQERDPVA